MAEADSKLPSLLVSLREPSCCLTLAPMIKIAYQFRVFVVHWLSSFLRAQKAIQAKAGRCESPEENLFFPENLSPSMVPHYPFSKGQEALMKLSTFESVAEMVRKTVEKKAMVFGQEVSLDSDENKGKYKIDPSVVSVRAMGSSSYQISPS